MQAISVVVDQVKAVSDVVEQSSCCHILDTWCKSTTYLFVYRAARRALMRCSSSRPREWRATTFHTPRCNTSTCLCFAPRSILKRLGELEAESSEAIGLSQQVRSLLLRCSVSLKRSDSSCLQEFMAAFMKFSSDPRVQQAAMAVQVFTQRKCVLALSLTVSWCCLR